ncbi:probable histone-lysine N-methyltransferase CG1716 [Drosophila innubila]|uniref:probable histone-lysine N-methyltransferase CG1716 n=1 Tax=Drosophila innubila TaxID=198719 RepID=UPI00148E1D71|nr:probable histone-lysine N-methyltransferase CG1716 [Drosophila innubila]
MDNFTTDATEKTQAPRKRLGRPPKISTQPTELIEDLDAGAGESSGSTSPTLCRRSTRKKIVKFDVLDLLNKSRKTHKIQIEARIDSNTPTQSDNVASTSSQAATASVNRFLGNRAPLSSVPALPALEIFAKPKPTPSLIVAQVSSDKTISGQQQPQLPIRKRGRPRKKQPDDTVDLDTSSSNSSTSFPVESKVEIESNLSEESSNSDQSLKGFSISVEDASKSDLETLDENALETNQEESLSDDVETEIITVLQSDEEDSDSQIIFVEIETETLASAEENGIPSEQRNFKLIFPKEKEKLEIEAEEEQDTESNPLAEQLIVEDICELLAEGKMENAEQQQLDAEVEESITEVDSEKPSVSLNEDEGQQEEQQLETVNDTSEEAADELQEMQTQSSDMEQAAAEEELLILTETTKEILEQLKQDNKTDIVDEVMEDTSEIEPEAVAVELKTIQAIQKEKPLENKQTKNELTEYEIKMQEPKLEESDVIPTKQVKEETPIAFPAKPVMKESPKAPPANQMMKETVVAAPAKPVKEETSAASPIIQMKDKTPVAAPTKPVKEETIISTPAKTVKKETIPVTPVKQVKEESPVAEPAAAKPSTLPLSVEPAAASTEPTEIPSAEAQLSTSKADSMESRPTEKKKTNGSPAPAPAPAPSPKREKASTSSSVATNVPIVECDALFKVLDEANAQMRHEEKTKKKLKQSTKKQKLETSRQSSPTPPTRSKKSQGKKGARRNTISEDHQEKETLPLTNKRRNSLHPFKASPSPERRPEVDSKPSNSSKKTKEKKTSRKGGAAKDSMESNGKFGELPSRSIGTPTSEVDAPNPLLDIAKFIEDGVKLLERDYKVDDEQDEQQEDEFSSRVANLETPATTPSPSPTVSSEDLSSGVRRSHRIKQKPQGTKSSVGRGSSSHTPSISMEQQLSELAHIEAINEQFLRQEGLQTFQTLRDNYYRCARQVSKENAEMQCDCFVTGDEEGLGQLRCGDGCINRMLMIECGPLCTNGDRCTNKRFQQHQGWPCRVFRTEKKGCGITAELQIPPGEFIMEYVGEVIDSEEFERRQHLYSEDRNRHYYFMALRGEAIIDATSKGNISRYINHSCDPNAETQKWTVNGELRIGFFSVKSILPGEEITFDYQYQRYGRDAQRCYCESTNCRGWIGNEPESDEGEQLDTESDSEPESLNEEPRLEQGQKIKTPKGTKSKAQLKLPAARRKRKEQPKAKDREYKAGRWLRPSGGASGEKSPSGKHDHIEDPDVLEQLTLLSGSGLKNQLDTLRFSRCMVRAKLLQTRLQLLGVLTRGELPCRRLFLDYHGLRLLHAWISESGSDDQLRLALLDALESLPIPNKTMLNDSRVYQSVELWSNPAPDVELDAVHQRILALLQKWNGLPEIFRIPKRERIEQMKEHEREADRQQQQHAAPTALEDSNSASSLLNTDRYRQDRFRRDTSSRYEKSKPPSRMSGNNTICTITTMPHSEGASGSKSESRRRSDFDPRRTITKEMRRSLFERKVAQDEAEKRVGSEDWREHEARCEYFGLDLNTDRKLLPFYQNVETNEWFNSDDMPVPTPPRCGDNNEPPSPEYPDDVEYKLPPHVEPLPPSWHWTTDAEGDIYYFNLIDRIPQWHPPTAEQRLQKLVYDEPEPEVKADEPTDELVSIDIDCSSNLSAKSMQQYIEAKIRERRELRRHRLVSVRVISPRREEDRVYNQQESRKYKENKEKIRRRKEIYRRTRNDSNNPEPLDDLPQDALPIQRYLYSSDDETTDCDANLSLADIDVKKEPGRSSETETLQGAKRKLPPLEGQKKHRSERDKKRKTASTAREASDKFNFEISGHVAELLRPYRQDNCQLGRITSDEDYKFLIKRLSQHITSKEKRYCDNTGNPLACTESVKYKSHDFIKQYMREKGPIYKRPIDKTD